MTQLAQDMSTLEPSNLISFVAWLKDPWWLPNETQQMTNVHFVKANGSHIEYAKAQKEPHIYVGIP